MAPEGLIDERNSLWVTFTVIGLQGKLDIRSMIDTGFTGELLLPRVIADQLQLEQTGFAKIELADGTIVTKETYSAKMIWGSRERTVTVTVADSSTPLLGSGALHGYTISADFAQKLLTIVEPKSE
jgi:clan AA aspartic protease